MHAIHFVRSRQEERELAWWLSFAAYDMHDRTLNNRIYLVYLIIFFGIWIFVTLTFFAGAGGSLLSMLNPMNPVGAAAFLMILVLSIWSIYAVWQSQKRSPVVFSEQDGYLICQTPVNRQRLTIRWLLMPWLESAIPFWLAAITLGFSIAETTMPGNITASRIIEYAGYGLRAWLLVIPLQLGLYALQWAAGIFRLHKNNERRWLAWVLIPISIAFFTVLSISLFAEALAVPEIGRIGSAAQIILSALPPLWIFALAALGLMVWISAGFNLSRAAEETREKELIHTAYQYGFQSYAEQLQSQQRLTGVRAPFYLPPPAGAMILSWKDLLQSLRSFRLRSLFGWVGIFFSMAVISFLPDPGSRALAIAFWIVQVGQASVIRLRGDLSRWSILRQLPIQPKAFILFELGPVYLLTVLISIFGLLLSSILFKSGIDSFVVLLPGAAAGTAAMAAFDVIRRSRSDLLMAGTAPEVSAGGLILAIVVGAVPVVIEFFLPGWIGVALAGCLSLGLGFLCFNLASHAFLHIGDS